MSAMGNTMDFDPAVKTKRNFYGISPPRNFLFNSCIRDREISYIKNHGFFWRVTLERNFSKQYVYKKIHLKFFWNSFEIKKFSVRKIFADEKFHKGLGTSRSLIYKMAELSFTSSSGLEPHTIPLKERYRPSSHLKFILRISVIR